MSDIAPQAHRRDLAWLVVAPVVALAWLVANHGLPSALPEGASARHPGAWLSELVAWALQSLTGFAPLATLLSVFSAAVLGVLAAYLLRRLLYNGWPLIDSVVFLAALAANAIVLRMVVSDDAAIPAMVAFAAVIPALRRLEAVGDAQAEMSFGLVLPLLFLAGPATALLTLPLALLGALLDPLARKDHRAFIAMFLVALMPTLLVIVGIAAFAGWDEVLSVTAVYRSFATPEPLTWQLAAQSFLVFAVVVAPFIVILIAYWVSGDDRRRQPLSAALVWVLPAYLLLGAVLFSWPIAPGVPAFAFLGAFAAWLAVARLHAPLRRAAIAIAVLTTIASWAL